MVPEVEAPISAPTPDADEMTRSPHQPTADQLAVVPPPTRDTPLPTDFQNEPALLAPPYNTVESFNSLSKMSPSCGAVFSEPSCVEKHEYDIEKAQTMSVQIHNPDDDSSYGSAMSRIHLSADPNSQPNDLEDAPIEIRGLQSAAIELQIQNGPSLPAPDNSGELFNISPKTSLSGGAVSSEPNYAEKHENHTERTQAPIDIVFPDGTEPRIGCKEGYLSPELPDAVTMATEGSASSGSPALSSFSMPPQSCFLQAAIPHTGGTQLSNDEIRTALVEPTSSADLIESPRCMPSLPREIQPSSHSNSAPARAALDSVEENQSPLHSKDHIRPQEYDPFDGSFPTDTMNRGRYTVPNLTPGQYTPSESSQIMRSRVQDYYPDEPIYQLPRDRYTVPNFTLGQYTLSESSQTMRSRVQDYYPDEPIYQLPRYGQGDRYQGQTESSSASELTYKRWPYDGQYQGQEYDVSRPYGVSNRWRRDYPVNDIPDDRPWSHGGRHQCPDYHGSNNDNSHDMNRPFEVRYQEQVCHLRNEESDDIPRPYTRQYKGYDHQHGTNVLNDMRQPRSTRYQQQPYGLDERNLGEAPQPYGSHYQRQGYWPEAKSCPVIPQSCRGHHQGQMDWLSDDIVDRVPPQHTARYQGRESRPGNDDFADGQRTERGPANFRGNDNFADVQITKQRPADNFASVQRTERGPAYFLDNEDFSDVRRTERGPATFLGNDPMHKMASQQKDQSQRSEFAEFKSHDAFSTNHELEYIHPQTLRDEFKGEVYQTTADPDFQKDLRGRQKSCSRDYRFNQELQSQKDQYYDAGSASKDESFSDTPQLIGQNRVTEEKNSSQARDGAGCESGTLVCDNFVSVPNSVKVVIGERNQGGGRTGGRITGNRVIR